MRVLSSWFSTVTKLLGFVLVLPIVLVQLTDFELNVWLLGLAAISLLNLVEFSITPTTVRQLSYQLGKRETNRSNSIATAAYTLHKGSALALAIISAITIFVYLHVGNGAEVLSPIIWGIPALLYLKLINAYFAAVLHANDRIPYHRLMEASANIFATLLTIVVLSFTTDIALLLCMQILPQAIIMPFIRHAAQRHIHGNRFRLDEIRKHWADIISPTINHLNAALIGFGALQLLAFYVSATDNIAYANDFLLSLRIIQSIAAFTNPLFYAYLPQLARLYESDGALQVRRLSLKKQRSAATAFFVFTQAFSLAIIVGPFVHFDFEMRLPQPDVWIILSIALLLHRIGAINLQTAALIGLVRFQSAEAIAMLAVLAQILLLAIIWNIQNIPINLLLAYGFVYLPISIRIRREAERQSQ